MGGTRTRPSYVGIGCRFSKQNAQATRRHATRAIKPPCNKYNQDPIGSTPHAPSEPPRPAPTLHAPSAPCVVRVHPHPPHGRRGWPGLRPGQQPTSPPGRTIPSAAARPCASVFPVPVVPPTRRRRGNKRNQASRTRCKNENEMDGGWCSRSKSSRNFYVVSVYALWR